MGVEEDVVSLSRRVASLEGATRDDRTLLSEMRRLQEKTSKQLDSIDQELRKPLSSHITKLWPVAASILTLGGIVLVYTFESRVDGVETRRRVQATESKAIEQSVDIGVIRAEVKDNRERIERIDRNVWQIGQRLGVKDIQEPEVSRAPHR